MNTEKLFSAIEGKLNSPDAVFDPYDLTFVWVSKKCCELVGFSEEELLGKQMFVICPQYKEPTEIGKNMMYDPPQERIIPIITKDKRQIKFKIKSVAVKIDDQPYHVGEILEVLSE